MTFSIAARCPSSGQFAVAVASSSPAVAARCIYAKANVGAVTTQNITDPRLGPAMLAMLEAGCSATETLTRIQAQATHLQYRQLTVIGRMGAPAYFSGAHTLGVHAQGSGVDVVSAGNLLANPGIPDAMIAAFEAASGQPLGTRVLGGMQAGPIRWAGLIVVDAQAWPVADLRVDWHDQPLAALAELWAVWQPQMHDYVARALNPAAAPAYGVPGNE